MADKTGLVIAIDKPCQWTSFQVVNKLKWHLKHTFGLKKFKIGHAGTLDPLASGLLLVCVGSATKQIEQLQAGVKEYTGTMVLGATTPCYDLEQAIDAYYPYGHITTDMIESTRQSFVGPLEQVPPLYSAVKVDGKRAYFSARDGAVVDIQPKQVTVYDFDITGFRPGREAPEELTYAPATHKPVTTRELYRDPQGRIPDFLPQMDFHITCSKGTYIRSIARDMGEALQSGAFLGALRRVRIGDYHLSQAIPLDAIEQTITTDNPDFEMLKSLS